MNALGDKIKNFIRKAEEEFTKGPQIDILESMIEIVSNNHSFILKEREENNGN